MMKKNKILILGAFDRYNYGDLLFPLMVERSIEGKINNSEFHFFGLKRSDMSKIGAKKTLSISDFYKHSNSSEIPTWVIVAGGEVLPITWTMLFSHLNPFYHILTGFKRFFDVEPIIKRFFGSKTELPFLISKESLGKVNGVFYNSIGASGANKSAFEKYKSLEEVKFIDYFSVRDSISFENFKNVAKNPVLTPDSAILLSNYFKLDNIVENLSNNVKTFVNDLGKKNFIFFQINKETYLFNKENILRTLEEFHNKYDVHICLCPIGFASKHSDQHALESIHQNLRTPNTFFPDVNIWDILYLIANSKIYLGTSLHGVITAMSYNVPYLGYSISKVENYLKTWGNDKANYCPNVESILSTFEIALSMDLEELQLDVDRQKELALQNFDNMIEIIKSND